MNYRSVAQLSDQVLSWSRKLPPEIEVVVGVPRSGLLAANLLALYRNIPLADVDGFLEGRCLAMGNWRGPRLDVGKGDANVSSRILLERRNVLVLDDSVGSGATLHKVRARIDRAKLPHRIQYGAVYVSPEQKESVDYLCEVISFPRVFEWNVLNHHNLDQSCLDMDGVLCRDPTCEENDDGEQYIEFLANAKPLLNPTARIGWIVTSRLERYRKETEDWLERHGVAYRELVMMNYPDGSRRRYFDTHSSHKAEVYRRTGAALFIESSIRQSVEICRLSSRDVLCVDTMQMIRPGMIPVIRPLHYVEDYHIRSAWSQTLRQLLPEPVKAALRKARRKGLRYAK